MNARAARYRHLVEEAAKQLKCDPSSELARHVGTLRMARETFAERLISGRDVNPADLVRLDDCLRQYLPSRPEDSPEPLQQLIARRRARQDELCPESAALRSGEVLPVADVRSRNGNGSGEGGSSTDSA